MGSPTGRRGGLLLRRAWFAFAAAALCGSASALAGPAPHDAARRVATVLAADSDPSGGSGLAVSPVDVAVLVDESGSIASPGDATLHQEQDAASLIALGELSAQSKVAVIGFGGVEKTGQNPVDPVCPLMTIDSPANRTALANCVAKLKVRTDAEGNDTDFITAIQEGLHQLKSSGDGNPKFIFMLTDGILDVWVGPGAPYPDADTAQRTLDDVALRGAREAGVQIWPLGFGGAQPDKLQHLADGGAPVSAGCTGTTGSAPPARIVKDEKTVATTMITAFAAARCFVPVLNGPAPPPVDLTVQVPAIATDASLLVLRRNTSSQVTFVDPNGRTVTEQNGSFDGSTFKLSGTDSAVVSLRVTNPVTGTWHVRVAAPTVPAASGSDAGQVTAVVLWQSVLRASIVLDTSHPVAGQSVVASMTMADRLSTLNGLKSQGLTASVTLSGPGVPADDTVPLRDAPVAPGGAGGNGVFSAEIPIPAAATGQLTFTGRVSGPGVFTPGSTQVSATVAAAPPPIKATVTFDPGTTVRQRDSVQGHVYVTNTGAAASQMQLSLSDADTPGALTITPATIPVPADGQGSSAFGIKVGADVPVGLLSVRVHAYDPVSKTDYSSVLQITVLAPRSWWSRHWPAFLGVLAAALALLVAGLVVYGRRLRAADVTDLVLRLFDDTAVALSSYSVEPSKPSRSALFAIRDAQTSAARFDEAAPDDTARYEVRRLRKGPGITVRVPAGEVLTVLPGRREPITDRLRIGYEDRRGDGDRSDLDGADSGYGYAEVSDPAAYRSDAYSSGYEPVPDYSGPAYTAEDSGSSADGTVDGTTAHSGSTTSRASGTAGTGSRGGRTLWRPGRQARKEAERPSPTYDDLA